MPKQTHADVHILALFLFQLALSGLKVVDTAAGEAGASPTPPAPSAAAPYSEGRSFPAARLEDSSEEHGPMAPPGGAALPSNGPPASSAASGKDSPSSRAFFRGDDVHSPGCSDEYPTPPAYRSAHGDARGAATGDESEDEDDEDDYPVYQPPHLRNHQGPPPTRHRMMPPSPPGASATMPPRRPHLPPHYRHCDDEHARYERQRGIYQHEREHRQYTPPPPPRRHRHYHLVGDAAASGGKGSSSRNAIAPR